MPNDNYAFATGKIRALEARLLNSTDIERMIDADNSDSAFKVFNDTDYADNLLDVAATGFKKALDDDLNQAKDLLTHIVPDPNLVRLVFLQYDFHNIKLAFKAKYSDKDLKDEASPFSQFPYSDYQDYIIEEQNNDLAEDLKAIIDEVKKELDKQPDSHQIDNILDKKYFELYRQLAKQIGNQFIQDLVMIQINIANVKIFLRAKRMNKDSKWLGNELINGGSIPERDFLEVYDKDLKEAFKAFSRCFPKQMDQAFAEYQKDQNLWQLEKAFEHYELEFTRKAKYLVGPEVIVAYYYAKTNAIRNVRLIMTGKLNKVKPEEIKQRVRELW
ncbi:MAG: V-type ATPase subunit [Patescibacteria group bacterium]